MLFDVSGESRERPRQEKELTASLSDLNKPLTRVLNWYLRGFVTDMNDI